MNTTRGLTLIELLIGISISLLAVTAAMVTFLSQLQSLKTSELSREASASSRDVLVPLESSLSNLGWGVDPRYAIDMLSSTRSVDRTDAPDELSFFSRNANYRWQAKGEGGCTSAGGCFQGNAWAVSAVDLAASPRTVTITLANGQTLQKGRIVMAVCEQGASPVMLTLSTSYTGAGSPIALAPVATASVPTNALSSLQTCHGASGAGLFLIDRYHFFVSNLASPWLMLDTGLDLDGDGNTPPTDADDLIPVAQNVEDIQVSYVLRSSTTLTAPDSNRDWVVGNDGATNAVEELDPNATAPVYSKPVTDPSRYTKHPANVEEIRVVVTIRSDKTDQSRPNWRGDVVSGLENRNVALGDGGYRRYVTNVQARLYNLSSRSAFMY